VTAVRGGHQSVTAPDVDPLLRTGSEPMIATAVMMPQSWPHRRVSSRSSRASGLRAAEEDSDDGVSMRREDLDEGTVTTRTSPLPWPECRLQAATSRSDAPTRTASRPPA
jgi:hypothetical protein